VRPAWGFTVVGVALTSALLYYATVAEPTRLEVTDVAVRDDRLALVLGGRTVAFLSDLHFGSSSEAPARQALRTLEEARPDMILLAGDYVAWRSGREAYQRALDFLSRLQAPLGVYAVLGDADRSSSRYACLFCHEPGTGSPTGRHRVKFLGNSSQTLDLPAGRLRLVGLDPGLAAVSGPGLRALLAGDTPTILLSHSSRVYRWIDAAKPVLTLSGDTHGGQVRLPAWFWLRARLKPDPGHMEGYFTDGNKSLFVTRGVGTSHVRFRLGEPPQLVIFRFPGGAR
jgi:predicted MPP superfamily phosphohydrolase